MNYYTTVLLYPPELTNHAEAYIAHGHAEDKEQAKHEAQHEAARANGGLIHPDEFVVLAVFAGRCEAL